jgi:phage terminase small subunit
VRDPVTGLNPEEALFLKALMTDAKGSVPIAGEMIGVSESQAYRLMQRPAVRKMLRESGLRAAARAELTAEEVINDLRELRDACLGRVPVKKTRIKDGEPVEVEVFIFDAMGAARALEKLGDYLQLWNSGSGSAGSNITIQIGTQDVRQYADGKRVAKDMGDAVVVGEDGQPVTAVDDGRVAFLIGGGGGVGFNEAKEGKEG